MAIVTFYEKPGCQGNQRQKALLAAAIDARIGLKGVDSAAGPADDSCAHGSADPDHDKESSDGCGGAH